jgi:uncharacterized protein (DUF427 family)
MGVAAAGSTPMSAAMSEQSPAHERVSEYPRPPRLEAVSRRVRIVFNGNTIADTDAALRVLETYHPPTYYLPMSAFRPGVLLLASGSSVCEWKGQACYWSIAAAGRIAERAGWSYREPAPAFTALRDHIAVYPAAMDACFVGTERVRPQPGGFYGGWITDGLVGPFKGGPGTEFW